MKPEVEKLLVAQQHLTKSSQALKWAIFNLFIAFLLYVDRRNGSCSCVYFKAENDRYSQIQFWVMVFFLFNAAVNLGTYFIPRLFCVTVALKPQQKKLMGFSDHDSSIITPPTTPKSTPSSANKHTPLSPISLNSSSSWVASSPGSADSSSVLATSWTFHRNNSLNQVGWPYNKKPEVSPLLHKPCDMYPTKDSFISDQQTLQSYLKNKSFVHSETFSTETSANSSSFWSYPVGQTSKLDYTPLLKKYGYQMAPKSPSSSPGVSGLSPHSLGLDVKVNDKALSIWGQFQVKPEQLSRWTENFRLWLCQTIFKRLVNEIDKVNSSLDSLGFSDAKIGCVGLTHLRSLSYTKSQYVPSLPSLLPYLENFSNQEYLIMRIKDLAKGGCMSEFKWNGGCNFKGNTWDESFPNDSMIAIQMFASYMDSRFPPHPNFPDGKTFTSQHLCRSPDKPALGSDTMVIYQSQLNPPHFQLIVKDKLYDVGKGRNNLFHTIILFLMFVKQEGKGMLGRVNLGLSGVNLLWVVES